MNIVKQWENSKVGTNKLNFLKTFLYMIVALAVSVYFNCVLLSHKCLIRFDCSPVVGN